MPSQIEAVEIILEEIEAVNIPVIKVMNKVDLTADKKSFSRKTSVPTDVISTFQLKQEKVLTISKKILKLCFFEISNYITYVFQNQKEI